MSKYSLRPYKSDKADLKDIFKIFLPSKLYISLRPNARELWNLENEQGKVVAVGRVSQAQEEVQNKVLQVSQEFKDLYDLSFTDVYVLRKSEIPLRRADKVTIVEVDSEDQAALSNSVSRARWEGWIGAALSEKLISPGLRFHIEGLEEKQDKRFFEIKTVTSSDETYSEEHCLFIHHVSLPCVIRIETTSLGRSEDGNFKIDRTGIFGLEEQLDKLDDLLDAFHAAKWNDSGVHYSGIIITGGTNTGKTMIMSRISQLSWKQSHVLSRMKIGKHPDVTLSKLAEECLSKEPCLIQIPKLDRCIGDDMGGGLDDALETMFGIIKNKRVLVVVEKKDLKLSDELGRCFKQRIQLTAPSEAARRELILYTLQSYNQEVDSNTLATIFGQKTPGFSGHDLVSLVERAVWYATRRRDQSSLRDPDPESASLVNGDIKAGKAIVTVNDLEQARLEIAPSIVNKDQPFRHRTVRWADIGGQEATKSIVERNFEWPLKYPEKFKFFNVKPAKGLLLYGPPGCSKTMTALALATEAKLNFIPVKGPELLSKYVGQSEENLRNIFARARQTAPCVIFFDEIDAIGVTGGITNDSHGSLNLVTTLLNELDGVDDLKGVSVLAATNRPWELDPALLRPGRFDGMIHVGLPDSSARKQILQINLSTQACVPDIDLDPLITATEGCSGAEIVDLFRNAAMLAMADSIEDPEARLESRHFEKALLQLRRDVTPAMVARYEAFANRARRA